MKWCLRVPQSSSNLFPLVFFLILFTTLWCLFGSCPILSNHSDFYRVLLMKCVRCCLGKTCPSDFSLFLKCVWFHLAAANPFFHKRIWLLSVIKMTFSAANCFSQLWIWQAHVFLSISVILNVVKTQSSQDFLFTIVQYKQCRVKETNEVFDNQFLSEASWADCGVSIIISCSVAVHMGFFFHAEVLILSLF